MLLDKSPDVATDSLEDDESGFFKKLIESIKSSAKGRLIQIVFDTIYALISSANVDVAALSKQRVQVDASRFLKRQNDILLQNTCELLRKSGTKISVFVDEIHFAYRDEETLQRDAMLVRDTIQAILNLNERFIEEKLDCVIYAGFRSEYMEQPVIAQAEILNGITSYGETLTWSTFPADKFHPIFDIIAKRVEHSSGTPFTRSDLLNSYLGNVDPKLFVEATWSKPRDIIRFFLIAKRMYPKFVTLPQREFSAVLREYSSQSWMDIKTAIMSFVPAKGIVALETLLKEIGPREFEKGSGVPYPDFVKKLQPVYATAEGASSYSINHFIDLLFTIGLIYTRYIDKSGQHIVNAYHRGNKSPSREGVVHLHRAIARSFS